MFILNKLYVVGIGPGAYEQMTIQAAQILETCDVIIGYTVYVDLIKGYFPKARVLTTPMKQEVKRCQMAYEEACIGANVAMVCSGDAGVYGMAGLILSMKPQYPNIEVEIIAGVSAAFSGGAVLGAPCIHDFAVISLSDLLTPWEKIEKRLLHAAQADFVICLYNPSSKKRYDYLRKACDRILQYQSKDTICGYVRNIGRVDEERAILSLQALRDTDVDMFTTVYIGNSQTKNIQDYMVTPRGYQNE